MKYINIAMLLVLTLPALAIESVELSVEIPSENIIFANPACVITTPMSPVIKKANESTNFFELFIKTQQGYLPFLSRQERIYSQLNNANNILLKLLSPSGIENTLEATPRALESINSFNTDFATSLFYTYDKAENSFPLDLSQIKTTITIECR